MLSFSPNLLLGPRVKTNFLEMGNTLDLQSLKFKNISFEKFDDNLADILIDALAGDPKALARPEIQAVGIDNLRAALQWMQTADVHGDYKNLLANEGWRLMYKRKPPSPEEYLTPEWIGGQAEGLWPNVRDAFLNFVDPDPLNPKRGLALSTSIGWGKANPVDSNIAIGKTIRLELEDNTKLEIPSDEIVEILINDNLTKVSANALLSMNLETVDLSQALIPNSTKIKGIDSIYSYKKLKDIEIGEKVLTVDGKKATVLGIQKNGPMTVYRVELSDGRSFRVASKHANFVHFRNSYNVKDKKLYDNLTIEYIKDHLNEYTFELPTDDTFSLQSIDFWQHLIALPVHDYEPIDKAYIVPDTERLPSKVYIDNIIEEEPEDCWCLNLNDPMGLFILENGIITHNSLLTNLCMSYIMVLFALMREPYRILGHSQPVYEKIQLPSGKYTTISDLKVGMKIAGVTNEESEVLEIIEQGEKDTYELTFENDLSCRCSMDHLWTVFDTQNDKYVVLPTKLIVEDSSRYLFPELEDCKKDAEKILQAECEFAVKSRN